MNLTKGQRLREKSNGSSWVVLASPVDGQVQIEGPGCIADASVAMVERDFEIEGRLNTMRGKRITREAVLAELGDPATWGEQTAEEQAAEAIAECPVGPLANATRALIAEVRRQRVIIQSQTSALDVAAEIAKMASGCAEPGCLSCERNKAIRTQIDAARKLGVAS